MREFVSKETLTLEQLRVGVNQMVSRELLNDAQFVGRTAETSTAVAYLGDLLAIRLRAFVLAHKVDDQYGALDFKWPASWWQHLKTTKRFPKWFLKRWPVRYQTTSKELHYEMYYNYPDARIALPEERLGRPVLYERITPMLDKP